MHKQLTRRDFLLGLTATVSGAISLSACRPKPTNGKSSKELHLYSWADYLHPDTIPEFERRYGIKVVYDTFASNESLLAKMQAGGGDYDLIVPTSYMVRQLKKLQLLRPLDKDRLPNFKNLMSRFQNPAFDPHCRYSLPYTWGTTGIGYNSAVFPDDANLDWDVFWDKRLAHRMTLLDDERETMGMSLKRNGHSYNTTSPELLRQACQDLAKQKPLTMCYTSDQVIVHLASSDSLLSLVYSGDAYQAARDNPQVRYQIPASGASLWTDNLCIPKSARNPENAHLWMNYMLEPEVAAATANYTRYATPNQKALPLVQADLLKDKNIYPPEDLLQKCEELGDIGSAIFLYDRLWTELKCV
jgi:spermidine/putrescine transport system substrate-binding protein